MTEEARQKIEDLFLRCGPGVGRYVLLRVGSPELAEEISARVFLTVVRQFHQHNGSLLGWLWAIVRTELARHYRQRPLAVCSTEVASKEPLPLEQMERKERSDVLRACLEKLPDEEQQLLSLKFFMGLGNQEIAEATGLTPSNVGVKLHRTLKELRGLLAETFSENNQ